MKFILLILVLAFSGLASCGQTSAKPDDVKKFKDDSEVPRMSLEDAKKAFDEGTVVIVDARSAEQYKDNHIKGAVSIPIGSEPSEFDKLPKGKKILVYCS
ncbi:MAG: rhodanese-like domain-containing protein [Acidobacteria bacterium]|nr:rhodanese-like domain-containing protein [Acidobacteriota bacterium]